MSATESGTVKLGMTGRIADWSARHPVGAIVLVSLLAVLVNCYPVIFCGRSFVSPAAAGALVYCWRPTLPGTAPTPSISQHGSDAEAMMIWAVPAGFIESRSLWQDGELPLWNRYGHTGDPFIGQAVSMLGDPLQLIVVLGHGSAVAWDLKFLTAKVLFCIGFGLLILRLLASRRLSLIYSILAAYCGAFFYIDIHPAFFVFSYAPWILLSALAFLDLRSERYAGWGLIWLLADFACFNAGHVELAVVLIGGLNLAALTYAWTLCRRPGDVARALGRLVVGTLLFLGLTAPVWLSFLAALKDSYSSHMGAVVFQLPPKFLAGAFDDIFYPNVVRALAPGTSLLVLAGCIFSALNWRQLKGETFFWINGCANLLWGGCVFGWVPASAIAAIPLLNRVGHTFTDFSYLLVIHLTIQSAYGFQYLAKTANFRRAAADFLWVVLLMAGLILGSRLGITQRPVPWGYVMCAGAGAVGAPLLFLFLRSRNRRISAVGWAGIILLGLAAQFRFGLYHAGDDRLLMIAGPRAVLNTPSPAIEKIQADKSGPFRTVGMLWSFYGDYAAVYGLEDIRSCAPLSNTEYIKLVRGFPGMDLSDYWILEVQDPARAQPLLNLLNVKYLLAPPATGLQPGLDFRILERSDFAIIENLDVWPRAFFSSKVLSIASNGAFIQHLLANGKQPFIALTPEEIQKQPGLETLVDTNPPTLQPAARYQLRPNSTAFDIHAPSAGVVCLTEGQARDFTATANGQPVAVLTVNRAFKGVYLDRPGDYHVEFVYRPHYWQLACWLFWAAAVAALILAAWSMIQRRPARNNTTIA